MTQGSHFEHAMAVMGQELAITSPVPVQRRVTARLVAELDLPETEAAAYASATFAQFVEAYTE